ncbi:PTS sugar transporter subunit IIB [Sodalis sp. RH23]
MKKILLCCVSGTSSSVLARRMQALAAAKGLAVQVSFVDLEHIGDTCADYDCLLLGPHIQYKLNEIVGIYNSPSKPVAIIRSIDYGMMDVEKILHDALVMLDESTPA